MPIPIPFSVGQLLRVIKLVIPFPISQGFKALNVELLEDLHPFNKVEEYSVKQ